jgi:hypothetical protein
MRQENSPPDAGNAPNGTVWSFDHCPDDMMAALIVTAVFFARAIDRKTAPCPEDMRAVGPVILRALDRADRPIAALVPNNVLSAFALALDAAPDDERDALATALSALARRVSR